MGWTYEELMNTPAQVVDDFMLIRNLRARVSHAQRQRAEFLNRSKKWSA